MKSKLFLLFLLLCWGLPPSFAQVKVKQGGQVAIGTSDPAAAKVNIVNANTSQTTGLAIDHEGQGTGTTAIGMDSKVKGKGELRNFGIRNIIEQDATATASKNVYGFYNSIISNTQSSAGSHAFGIWTKLEGVGSGPKTGINSSVIQNANELTRGIYTNVNNSGTGTAYGLYITINTNGTGNKYGLYSIVNENANAVNPVRGIQNVSNFFGPMKAYGIQSVVNVNSNSTNTKFGLHSEISIDASGAGTGPRYALFSKIASTGTGHYAGYFSGNVHVIGNVTESSDFHLKKNIQDLNDCLAIITALKPKKYQFKDNIVDMSLPQGDHFGLIAQEVEEILPELVDLVKTPFSESEDPNNHEGQERIEEYKALNYQELIPILIGAVKEQQVLIDKLKERIERLENE